MPILIGSHVFLSDYPFGCLMSIYFRMLAIFSRIYRDVSAFDPFFFPFCSTEFYQTLDTIYNILQLLGIYLKYGFLVNYFRAR